jgi:hypothetical protein
MAHVRAHLTATIVGVIVLFAWSALSHLVLPWYRPSFTRAADEVALASSLRAHAPTGGLYVVPFDATDRQPGTLEALVSVLPNGPRVSPATQILRGFALQAIAVFIVVGIVRRCRADSYIDIVAFCSTVGFVVGFSSASFYWNWFNFPLLYAVVYTLDAWIGWTVTGLCMASLLTRRTERQLS